MLYLLNPRVWIAAIVVAVLALTHLSAYRVGRAAVRTAWDKERAAQMQAQLKAEAAVRLLEQNMQRQVERIANEAAKKQAALSARAAATELAAGQLRDEIARLNARPAPTGAELAAVVGEARTARELLGACSGRYESVARSADELRDQVSGLQDFVKNVSCQRP